MLKRDIQSLKDIQYKLSKGIDFIKNSKTVVCSTLMPDNLSYYNKEGQGISPINKEMGSEICYLYRALESLSAIIASQENTKEDNSHTNKATLETTNY